MCVSPTSKHLYYIQIYLRPWNIFSLSNRGSLAELLGAVSLRQFLRIENAKIYGFPEIKDTSLIMVEDLTIISEPLVMYL